MAAPIDLTGQFTPSLTHAEQQHAQQMHNQQLQALRSVKAEDRQEYEEDHRSFTTFSQDLADKWEQRFEALATLARAAGVSSGDIEAIRKQERQPAPEPTPAEGTAGQAAAEEQEHAQAAAASKPAAGKKLSKHIQKTVDKGEAAIDPAGDELTAAGLIIGEYVWGEYADDGVWYPGEVLAEPLTSLPCVRFDDGEQDDELEGRAWRRRKPPPPQQQQPTQPTQPRHGKQAEQDAVPAKRRRKSATAAAPEAAATAGAAAGSGTGAAAGAVAGVTGAASVAATAVAAATVAPAVAANSTAAADLAAQTNQARSTIRAPGKPMCQYGKGCYREQPSHWQDFDHPADHPKLISRLAEIAQSTSTALVCVPPNVQPPTVKDLRRWWDRRREDSDAAAGDAYVGKPSDVPGPICILTFEKLDEESMCVIVSQLVWESCSRLGASGQDEIFVAICAAFSFVELAALERTSSLGGMHSTYPSGSALGVDPARAGMPKRYSPKLEAVIKKAAPSAGLAGVMAVDVQDFLENVQKHTQSGGKVTLQWLRSLATSAQKEELHSLLLVQAKKSTKVRHGLQFLDGLALGLPYG